MIITVISPIPETGVNTCRIASMMVIVKMVSFEVNKVSPGFFLQGPLSMDLSPGFSHKGSISRVLYCIITCIRVAYIDYFVLSSLCLWILMLFSLYDSFLSRSNLALVWKNVPHKITKFHSRGEVSSYLLHSGTWYSIEKRV